MLESKAEGGFWTTFDWEDSISKGMDIMDLPYSGDLGFVETNYVYPTTHMVAPKENVVECAQCHASQNSRLSNLAGFYMPGRDNFKFLDTAGWLVVAGAMAGVCLHALGRIVMGISRRKEKE